MPKTYQVKEIADIVGVSVRTLHYYDEIKLLTPSARSSSGYRLYVEDDLLRLQQILLGRSLGLALEEIRRSLDDPDFDYPTGLRRQRSQLVKRIDETHQMIASIDRTLNALANNYALDLPALFEGFNPQDFEAEAQRKWGNTAAFKESAHRSQAYNDADWATISEELNEIWSSAAQALTSGEEPTSDAATEIVRRHRDHICRWFYELTPAMHADLAELWVSDERFTANIDRHAEGLTTWLRQAVIAVSESNDKWA